MSCWGQELRNVPGIITHVHSHCSAHLNNSFVQWRSRCRCRRGFVNSLLVFPARVSDVYGDSSEKLKLLMNCFETFPECSLLSIVSKKTIKLIDHHSRLRDVLGQSYPIYACTRANQALFIGSRYILWQLETWQVESVEHIEQYHINLWKIHTIWNDGDVKRSSIRRSRS